MVASKTCSVSVTADIEAHFLLLVKCLMFYIGVGLTYIFPPRNSLHLPMCCFLMAKSRIENGGSFYCS